VLVLTGVENILSCNLWDFFLG